MVNWISVRSLLAITIIYEFPSRKFDFILAFTLSELDVDVFMEIHLGMGVDGNIGEWFLKLNKSLYVINQASSNCFDHLKTVLERMGCDQYQIYPCVFYINESFILTYVDYL